MTLPSDLASKTRYDPSEVEPRIAERWLESGLFHPRPEGTGDENYSIAIPLPNVTGVLHMGHALNNSVQDCLIRFHRMRGQRTKWILGTDHAGIATQTQVERALGEEGTSREQLGREAFVERVWRWRDEYGGLIIEQLKRLGCSLDYEDERFTLDRAYAQAVLDVFVALYEKGYIYRDRYMVNWDPGTRSAISDLEVTEQTVTDTLYFIEYPLASGDGAVTIATVRPETMLADTAVAVNPVDTRYEALIGQTAILPLVGRELPIIADDYVKPEFGTGALKVTPAHDPNDFEIGRRHGLAQVSVIGEDGRITAEAPERFAGLAVPDAQRAVVEELSEQGLITRTEPYTHAVPFSERSGERIEPLVSLQWFMRMEELARRAIEVVESGQVRFWPESYKRVYLHWMENIRPWCISRQLWWGHQIPVWYRGEETYVGASAPDGEGWERDPDVLDTWFSSALFPFAALGWPEPSDQLKAFYPTDALVTGREIVFLWVARMIMMGLEFLDQIPFTDVYVHAIIHAPDGRRMSKSLGTGVDPLGLIDGGPRPSGFEGGGEFPPYGADAVRWGMLAMSSTQDVNFSEERIAQGLALVNKLWNAARLVLLGVQPDWQAAPAAVRIEDRWILSRLARVRAEVQRRIEGFDFAHVAFALYDFIYGELCDWYLELVKPRLREGEPEAGSMLLYVLTETLAIAHPVIPFVTEEIYSYLPGSDGLLAAGIEPRTEQLDEQAEAALQRMIEAVQALRAWRDFAEVKVGATLPARLAADGYEETEEQLARMARLSLTSDGAAPVSSVAIPGGAVELLPSPELDLGAAERKRAARRAALEAERERSERKLANPGFVSKAPAEVVQAEREKLARLQDELEAV